MKKELLKRFFLFFLGVTLSFVDASTVLSQTSLTGCARTPGLCAELASIRTAAAAAISSPVPIGYIPPATAAKIASGVIAGGAAVYTATQIGAIQDAAISTHNSANSSNVDYKMVGASGEILYHRVDGGLASCQWKIAFYSQYGQLVGASCVPIQPLPTWDSLTPAQRDAALADPAIAGLIGGLASSSANTNRDALTAAAIAGYTAAATAYQSGDIPLGDSRFADANSYRDTASTAAAIGGSTLDPSVGSAAAAAAAAKNPTATPSASPSASRSASASATPFADDLINKSQAKSNSTSKPSKSFAFTQVNFLTYAVSPSGFGNKFPFGMFAPLPESSQPMACPRITSWVATAELCFIRDIFTAIKWIVWTNFAINSFVNM